MGMSPWSVGALLGPGFSPQAVPLSVPATSRTSLASCLLLEALPLRGTLGRRWGLLCCAGAVLIRWLGPRGARQDRPLEMSTQPGGAVMARCCPPLEAR